MAISCLVENKPKPPCFEHDLRTVVAVEQLQQVGDVLPDRGGGDVQLGGDRFVGQAEGEEFEGGEFPVKGQRIMARGRLGHQFRLADPDQGFGRQPGP